MDLYSISASRFEAFATCPRRYVAEYEERTPRSENGGPADNGTVCHNALEDYVYNVYFLKIKEPSLKYLLELMHMHFGKIFRFVDKKDERYIDCIGMLKNWFKRSDNLSRVTVISMELRSHIYIKTKDGQKKYNYVWDRCDEFWEDEYGNIYPTKPEDKETKHIVQVVDYKSYRKNLNAKAVKNKLQFKMYAVAAMAQFKDKMPDELWIVADMLRYGEVPVKFTVEECREIWKDIRDTANLIIDFPSKNAEETLGEGCMYCVRKATCKTLSKNIDGGGTFSLLDDEQLADALYRLTNQEKAAKYGAEEIKKLMKARAEEDDLTEWSTASFDVAMKSRAMRAVNVREVAMIIGDDELKNFSKINVGEVEKMIKSGEFGEEKTEQLRGVFYTTYSDPSPDAQKRG